MSERTIKIPAPNFREMTVTIRGKTPLLCDRYGERTMALLEDREAHPSRRAAKKVRDPEGELRDCLYVIASENGDPARYGFPASAIKKAIISAAGRFAGLDKMGPTLGGAIQIDATDGDLLELRGPEPRPRKDPRSIKGVRSSIIYRMEFAEWEIDVPVTYDADLLDEAQILNLLARAGEQVGIGNWRPEKKGVFGRFEIVGGRA